jgi:predicted DNA-binding transcriptional regulator YafY
MPQKQNPDSTPGIKILRLFSILLLEGRRHFLKDLSDRLECSPQTVIRMIREVEQIVGSDLLYGIDNRRRWYQLAPKNSFTLGLDYEELRYLNICRGLSEGVLPPQTLKRIDRTLEQLAMHMADPVNVATDRRLFTFSPKGRIDYEPHAEHIQTLIKAARDHRVCMVVYKAPTSPQAKEHRYQPVRLIAMNNALYSIGCLVGEDYDDADQVAVKQVNFAVHRMRDVVITEQRTRIRLPDMHVSSFGLPWHEPRTFTIEFAPEVADYVCERVWSDQQEIERRNDGGVILTITTRSEPELRAWVRGFGDKASIRSDDVKMLDPDDPDRLGVLIGE